jgi:glutaredoxin
MSNGIEITLIGKPGCHLCDNAREALAAIITDFEAEHTSKKIAFTELSILDDPALALNHSEEIPVVLVNQKMFSYWHVDEPRLRGRLQQLAEEGHQ